MSKPPFSSRLANIGVSPILAALETERAQRAQGQDIVSLTAGEPDFPTPEYVVAAAVEAMRAGDTKYPPLTGSKALKAAICEKFQVDNGLSFEADQIIVSTGSKQAIYNALMATLDPGDEVVIPAPYWTSYPDMVRVAGGAPVFVTTSPEEGYQLNPARFDKAITPRTKWLLLNSPSNPTGAVYSEATLAGLGEVLRHHPHVSALCDDIYEHISFEAPVRTLAQVAPDLADRCLIVNGVSKAYAMTGWRLGYAAGPTALIGAMSVVQSQSTSGANSISQAAAVAALFGPKADLHLARDAYRRRRDFVTRKVARIAGLRLAPPQGAFYALVDCREVLAGNTHELRDDLDLTNFFLRTAQVSVVPGSAFGATGFVRLSFAAADSEIERGLDRIAESLSSLSS